MRNTAEAEVVTGGGALASKGAVGGIHEDFARFRSQNALLKAHLPRAEVDWAYYQAGPTSQPDPLIFLHGTSGTAAAFFYQVQALGAKGYRVISAQYPAYDTPEDWSKGFDHFLDILRCKGAHVFGAGLGGFLAQDFAAKYPHRLRSLLLCNSFASTRSFAEKAGHMASVVHITPTPLLRKFVFDSFPQVSMTLAAKQAIDFVADQVNEISGIDLAGRLSLNSTESCAAVASLEAGKITLIESSGETMVPDELRRELRHRYASCRMAEMKSGGDFPFLSHPDEVTLFVEVHMRGIGVFAGGRAPVAAGHDAASAEAWTRSSAGAGYVAEVPAPPRAPAASEVEEPAPVRRPKWINPFDEPPPRISAKYEDDPLL